MARLIAPSFVRAILASDAKALVVPPPGRDPRLRVPRALAANNWPSSLDSKRDDADSPADGLVAMPADRISAWSGSSPYARATASAVSMSMWRIRASRLVARRPNFSGYL